VNTVLLLLLLNVALLRLWSISLVLRFNCWVNAVFFLIVNVALVKLVK
jgi:hypothetical protein